MGLTDSRLVDQNKMRVNITAVYNYCQNCEKTFLCTYSNRKSKRLDWKGKTPTERAQSQLPASPSIFALLR